MSTRNYSIAFLISVGFVSVFETHAQVGTCRQALGESYLDINNVRARIFNNGNLFWRGSPNVYNVPKGGSVQAIFTSGIWIGGNVGGQLRVAAARYGDYHFWAGPLDDNGAPPADCSQFDRLYEVSIDDVQDYEATGLTTPDLRDWPTGLGAPTYARPRNGIDDDGDGVVDEDGETIDVLNQPLAQRVNRVIDLASGERPAILGDQSIWWVMNDRGNEHEGAASPPIGVEVHVTAFAFRTAGDIGNTTFYRYNIYYKGNSPFTDVHMAIFSDPDLGNFQDDWVGSDTTLGVGYVWNSDNEDEGSDGYGSPVPAIGYDFFQGPVIPSPSDSAKVDGQWIQDFRNLNMTSFTFYSNDNTVQGDPSTALDHYNYMKGQWKDGRCITEGGNGRDFSDDCTAYMFPGDPGGNDSECEYWSECNLDGAGTDIEAADRRFVMGTGPFTINPEDFQQIVFGLIWAQGADNFDSVQRLKNASELAQSAYNNDFQRPSLESVADQNYTRGTPIVPLVLPEASLVIPPVVYMLTPELPAGLSFDAPTRTIMGVPLVSTSLKEYTYMVTDAINNTASVTFTITVSDLVSSDATESLPVTFKVVGSYPNPFRTFTHLQFDLPWPASVRVEILDVMGRRVFLKSPADLPAGWSREIALHNMELPSGLYLYRLAVDSHEGSSVHTGRLVQVR